MATLTRSHKIALHANNKQKTYFAKAAGTARFAYNWGLARWQEQYEAGEKPSEARLRRQLNAIKREQFPWMTEVTKCAPQLAIMNLGQAFKNFFAGRAKRPRFKKKGHHDSFELSNDQFRVEGQKIRIPNLGWVKLWESLRFHGKIVSATISREGSRWYVSIAVEVPKDPAPGKSHARVGVDLGIKTFAVLSTGEALMAPKPHKALLQRLRKLSRSLSRKKKGGKNRLKAKRKLACLHARIKHIREDALHKASTYLAQEFGCIVVEDLNVSGMLANRRLARSIADLGFYEFRRQLEYKAKRFDREVVVASRWFASSKLCSSCARKNDDLTLKDRRWLCLYCGAEHERDFNAAKNLAFYKDFISTVSLTGINAWGEDTLESWRKLVLTRASLNQEFDISSFGRIE